MPELEIERLAEHRQVVAMQSGSFEERSVGVCGMAVSPDGKLLASTSREGGSRLWRADAPPPDESDPYGSPVARGEVSPPDWIRAACFVPGADRLLLGSDDGRLWVWSYQQGDPREIARAREGIRSLAVSPDAAQAAVGGEDGGLYLVPIERLGL